MSDYASSPIKARFTAGYCYFQEATCTTPMSTQRNRRVTNVSDRGGMYLIATTNLILVAKSANARKLGLMLSFCVMDSFDRYAH